MKEEKKPTRDQLERRINNAIVFIPKDKEWQSIHFTDKGLKLEVTSTDAVISTNYHRHVFHYITGLGYSQPYMYTKRVIEIAHQYEKEIIAENGHSFAKLLDILKAKEDQGEYNICVYYEWWVTICFNPLYTIDTDEVSSFLVFFKYCCVLATQQIILDEHKTDLTTTQFFERFKDLITEFASGNEERVLFHALTDEERVQKEIEAIQQNEQDELLKGQA